MSDSTDTGKTEGSETKEELEKKFKQMHKYGFKLHEALQGTEKKDEGNGKSSVGSPVSSDCKKSVADSILLLEIF